MKRRVWECFKTCRRFLPLHFNVVLEYAIMNIQVNQEDFEMTHQILNNADDVNFLGRNIRKIY
jgi:hypothetical protein